jgi:AIPR protein
VSEGRPSATFLSVVNMSALDVQALETNFNNWRKERVSHLTVSDAFERYAVEQVLKDADLSDDEIDSGLFGGPDDGGVDGMYFFVNRVLIEPDSDVPDPAITANLSIVQAKHEKGFKEDTVQKIHTFTRDLLNWAVPVDSFSYLSTAARDAISLFREKYNLIIVSPHIFSVDFCYVTTTDESANPKVKKRANDLCEFVRQQISIAEVNFHFWDCRRLLAAARTAPVMTMALGISKHFTTDDNSAIALVKLTSFAEFLTDEHGLVRRHMLEPNVRDYQGANNPVNREIRQTLQSADNREFWWLNNGITILASSCSVTGNKLTIERPEIVNGLQTSQEIHAHFKDRSHQGDTRSVMIRVIVPPDAQTRNRITKATNFQTAVTDVMLHATDPIHFDIEDRLKLQGLFYDRRKGEYRQQRKPVDQIVSITALAQAVIAILLQRPDDARARPGSLLKREETYRQIFEENHNRDVFVSSILIDRQVLSFLEKHTDLTKDVRRDIRYYVVTWVSCVLANRAIPSAADIAGLLPKAVSRIPPELLTAACKDVLQLYQDAGGTDAVSKSPEFTKKVLSVLSAEFRT